MALVTLQLSSIERSSNSIPVQDEEKKRRSRMQRRQSFVMVKGAALLLQDDGDPKETTEPFSVSGRTEQHLHLQAMLRLLREEDTLKLAVRLEPVRSCLIRYLLVVSSRGQFSEEETILLGVDFPHNGSQDCTIGIVIPIWSNTQVFLDGDGGFSVTSGMDVRAFKPISVQTMWSLLQILHKACEGALSNIFTPGSSLHSGVTYYQQHRGSPQSCVTAWTATSDIIGTRKEPTTPEREETERIIRRKLRDILSESDLENITSKEVRSALEQHTLCDLQDYTEFIDNEMIIILAQMDRPSEIFHYLYLGSEWNASNLEELQKNKVSHILNVTREIDNFYPEIFKYLNIRVLDEENTNLLQYWKETHHFISSARHQGSRVLVHCKMGVSRSASTVIAYAMKEYEWTLETAMKHVKERRSIVQPNAGFLRQLQIYQGILGASKQRHSNLWEPCSTLVVPQVISPPKTFSSQTIAPLATRQRKINLRALMRSISEMESTETGMEQEENIIEQKNISDMANSVPENFETMFERKEYVTCMEENSVKQENVMEQEEHIESKEKENAIEDRTVCATKDNSSEIPFNEIVKREHTAETLMEKRVEITKESTSLKEKSTSVDEVFGIDSPSSQLPNTPTYDCWRSRDRKKHPAQQPADSLQGCYTVKSQSVSDLEGAALVSTRLQGVEQGGRRARITRQSNVGDTPENP